MALRFYLAGEASSDHGNNWRGTITGYCWIYDVLEQHLRDASAFPEELLVERNALPGGFDFVGAYLFYKGHYLYDTWQSGYGPAGIAPLHRQAISLADVMWVWLPKAGAGTWTEIGYAAAKGIPIVFADQGVADEYDTSTEEFSFAFANGKKYVYGENARQAWDRFAARPMAFMRYTDYLNTAHWRETRANVLQLKGKCCHSCFSHQNIQVHHLTYERVGRELPDDLTPLCESCHRLEHAKVLK